MKHCFAVLLSTICVALPSWATPQCLHYEGDPVALNGKVTLRTFYGPPNYGENPKTDFRETQVILVLSQPICVEANPNLYAEEEKNQRKVTLVPSGGIDFRSYRGRFVTVEGTLFHAHTAHHRTPVLMKVVSVSSSHE
jgi:hypothetical protein